jgi:hypothetical protein
MIYGFLLLQPDGTTLWRPNPNLRMTEAEQRAANQRWLKTTTQYREKGRSIGLPATYG